jgi:HK97 family phage prohead protease
MPTAVRQSMPDGSFHIESEGDLAVALREFGEMKTVSAARRQAVKRHIILRAHAMQATEVLPAQWRSLEALFPAGEKPQMRSAGLTEVEVSPDGKVFRGYAAVFDVVASLAPGLTESVARGAFRKVLKDHQHNIPFLYDHGGPPLMTTAAGTLRLGEDTKGLEVEGDLPEHHTHVRMLREQVDRGEVAGMSWGFVVGPGMSRIEQRGAGIHRELLDFKRLLDVSPTWDPTYAETDAEIRAMRYNFLAESSLYLPQQFHEAESQEQVDGAEDKGPDAQEEEQHSGVVEEAAARNRQFAEMELDDRSRLRNLDIEAMEILVKSDLRRFEE